MGGKLWILIGLIGALILLGLIAFIFAKGKKRPTDYYAFFVIGLVWAVFGIFSFFRYGESFNTFFIIGIVFMIIGLAHKDKWKKNRRTFKNMSESERKLMKAILIILTLLLAAGMLVFLLLSRSYP